MTRKISKGSISCARFAASIPACRAPRTSTPATASSRARLTPAPAAPTTSTSTRISGRALPNMRTIIAGVGYINLSDSSVGPIVFEALKKETWPEYVKVDDLSYGPISVVHNFIEANPRYERMILISAADFGAKPPALRWHRWPAVLPDSEEIKARVVEAATGVIDWKNLLIILQQFDALPSEVFVIAVQPVHTTFGMDLSSGVQEFLPEVLRLARELATKGVPVAA